MRSQRTGTRGGASAASGIAPGRDGAVPGATSPATRAPPFVVREFGLVGYVPAWEAMKSFTLSRGESTPDEIWLLQHPRVYTVGIAGRTEHGPFRADIPVVKTDRGGQITYHGPGQAVTYLLLDLRRLRLGIRELVRRMENAVVSLLAEHSIDAHGREDAPGVYVGASKIASLGLRVRNGCCYHGVALNCDMDLAPFRSIDPCGHPGLDVTQLRDLGVREGVESVGRRLSGHLARCILEN